MMKMKLIVNALPLMNVQTGVGRYIRNLYEEMDRIYGKKIQIKYFDGLTLHDQLPKSPDNLSRWSGKVLLFWKLPPVVSFFIRMVIQYLREFWFYHLSRSFDIYHETGFFPFKVHKNVKTFLTIYDLSLLRFPQFHPKERVMFYNHFFKKRCSNIHRYFSISNFTKDEMIELLGVREKDITVTLLSCDHLNFYQRNDNKIAMVRKKFELPQQYFLFVGTLEPRKNIRVIVEALKKLSADIPVVIVGWEGWDRDLRFDGRRLIYIGYVCDDDLASIYSGARALIYPSLYEGFGLPPLEAMACGCPVITTYNASLPEVVAEAALYLKDAHNPSELADLMAQLLNNKLREDLIQKGLKQSQTFSWQKNARQVFNAFREN